MKVIFLGYHSWGVVALNAILESRHTVPLVITHPEKNNPYDSIWNDSVINICQKYNIPFIKCSRINNHNIINQIREIIPDIIFSCNWRTYLSKEVLEIPKFKSINIHEALLPKYGGFAPISWAIINGETETGVTVHLMDEDIDVGDIILQEKVEIAPHETATDIYYKTLPLFADLSVKALNLIEEGQVITKKQNINELTFFHKRYERDNLIDWKQNRIDVYNLIRAQSDPYPNAFTYYNGKKVMIKYASLADISYCGTPGRVFCRINHGVVVLCGFTTKRENQGIIIYKIQEENGEIIEASEYFTKIGVYLGD